jgi:hypothetical protein
MGKPIIKPNARANQILDDLEQFLDFCRDYGYRYNEADLYNFKSYAYQQYNKFANGKNAKDMWIQDNRRG